MKVGPEDQLKVLEAAADLGRANGLLIAAKLIAKLGDHKGRVVGTKVIRDLAETISEEAEGMKFEARRTLQFYSIVLNSK